MRARIDSDVTRAVRERTDLAAVIGELVTLEKRGADLVGLCFFHSEKTPSFHVHPGRGFFKCFGCGAGGDVITFAMRASRMTFPGAVRHLAERAGVEIDSPLRRQRPPRPTASDVHRELDLEGARYREQHHLDSVAVRLVAADLDEIRRRVSARLGVSLPPVQRRISDSFAGGRERDPLWSMLLERAWLEAWIVTTGSPALYPIDEFARLGRAGVAALEVAERRAAGDVRAIVAANRGASEPRRAA